MAEKHPFDQTMNELLKQLGLAVRQRTVAEGQIASSTNAIRALAMACEDEEVRNEYLRRLEEVNSTPGFKDAVLEVFREHPEDVLTPKTIRDWIVWDKKMDLSSYSNPLASIHTTLRRLEDSGVIEPSTSDDGEKAYTLSATEKPKRGLQPPPSQSRYNKSRFRG